MHAHAYVVCSYIDYDYGSLSCLLVMTPFFVGLLQKLLRVYEIMHAYFLFSCIAEW